MGQGLKMIEGALRTCHENERKFWSAMIERTLGRVYLQIVDKSTTVSLTTMAKNAGFMLKNVPSAGKKAEEHFNKAIEVAKEIGAKSLQGQAYLDLGRLHKAKGKSNQAQECFTTALKIFEGCQSKVFLKQAKEALTSFG